MSFRQLIYCSRATREMTDQDLLELLREAWNLNAEHDITGLLVFVEHHFMQCIEGAPLKIEQLVENIRNDRRNEEFLMLMDREREARAFPGWTMGFRLMSLAELRCEEGFQNIRHSQDLERIDYSDETVFNTLANFYKVSSGRHF